MWCSEGFFLLIILHYPSVRGTLLFFLWRRFSLKPQYEVLRKKKNRQTDLKGQRNFILFCFVYMADPATFLASHSVLGPYSPLRAAGLFSKGTFLRLCCYLINMSNITFLSLKVTANCSVTNSSKAPCGCSFLLKHNISCIFIHENIHVRKVHLNDQQETQHPSSKPAALKTWRWFALREAECRLLEWHCLSYRRRADDLSLLLNSKGPGQTYYLILLFIARPDGWAISSDIFHKYLLSEKSHSASTILL